ncbi:hypothetical protein [Cyclobacterium plantarum]|uniref:Uncharacterized protein n=1 Tax=Cyclobacterium plantarum TaxID=2716263 RepID=A0ABX0H2H8_9BACT|nr:hypothetical protein [Cyclobacterium plantarum]NHE55677.1 hypothetical protein [Cyclobacterium plantarum]
MKNSFVFLGFLLILISSCSPETKESEDSLPMKVAKAYGFDHLDEVKSISYTWNVRRDSATVLVRDWAWDLENGEVSYSGPDTTATYLIANKTKAVESVDQKFINDKYWLLFPFHLGWDEGYEAEIIENQRSPINADPTTKIIIRYNDSDGYTPGDAYDIYIDENHMIKEWVFRRGDGPEGRAFTWENVADFGNIKIAQDHHLENGEKIIWFTNVEVVKK